MRAAALEDHRAGAREVRLARDCDGVAEPPAPAHPMPRGFAGPSLLAAILVGRFGDHLPLNRQSAAFAREGVELDCSTLADWVGGCVAALASVLAELRRRVLAAERLHVDDPTAPALAKTKTRTGRLWVYVRDDRPFGAQGPPAAIFHYSRDRRGEHPRGVPRPSRSSHRRDDALGLEGPPRRRGSRHDRRRRIAGPQPVTATASPHPRRTSEAYRSDAGATACPQLAPFAVAIGNSRFTSRLVGSLKRIFQSGGPCGVRASALPDYARSWDNPSVKTLRSNLPRRRSCPAPSTTVSV